MKITDEQKQYLFGFIIDNDVQLDISNKRITRLTAVRDERLMVMGAAFLNDTMVRFLVCLLTHYLAGETHVSKQSIFDYFWNNHNCIISSQHLWRNVRDLRFKLESVGLDQGFITSIGRTGFTIKNHVIYPLFFPSETYRV